MQPHSNEVFTDVPLYREKEQDNSEWSISIPQVFTLSEDCSIMDCEVKNYLGLKKF